MRTTMSKISGILILVLLIIAAGLHAENVSIVRDTEDGNGTRNIGTTNAASVNAAFTGSIKVYIVEPTSRWTDADGYAYDYGFLDWGFKGTLDIPENGTWEETFTWDAGIHNASPITENNIMAIAVVFNDNPIFSDAYPPNGYYFNAYYNEAAAGATPGNPGMNYSDANFTHTIFIEEGTATW